MISLSFFLCSGLVLPREAGGQQAASAQASSARRGGAAARPERERIGVLSVLGVGWGLFVGCQRRYLSTIRLLPSTLLRARNRDAAQTELNRSRGAPSSPASAPHRQPNAAPFCGRTGAAQGRQL
eukprot:COSAG04_NODE_91_length_26852_cov_8.609315_36_plen_125_part_00